MCTIMALSVSVTLLLQSLQKFFVIQSQCPGKSELARQFPELTLHEGE